MLDALKNFVPPNVGLGNPSDRPDEPVTAGLGVGPGGGPEMLQGFQQPAPGPNPDVLRLARHLPMLEMLASRPNTSATTRSFVRRLRASLPADFDFNDGQVE